jgi:hypothetical protein
VIMVVRQPLFESNDTTDQTAEIFRLLFRDFLNGRAGILSDTAFEIRQRSAGADASVDVKSGSLMLTGTESANQGFYHVVNDKDLNLSRPQPPNTTLSRIDTIVVRVRDSVFASGQGPDGEIFDDGILEWVAGTPVSGTPIPPDLDALGYENYYKLANVSVPAGSPNTPTTSSNITDLRSSSSVTAQNRAVGVGGIAVCTSTTRPASPRHGQAIWQEDTKELVINEGTTSANWVTYGTSGMFKWKSYSSSFPVTGTKVSTWGRYVKVGRIVFGTAGFRFSPSGTGNVTTRISCRVPVKAANPGVAGLIYLGGGRAHDSTGILSGVFWSGSAVVAQNDLFLRDFASAGLPIWDANNPFNWGSGVDLQKSDVLEMFFCYESAE